MSLEVYSQSFVGDGTQDEFELSFPNANSTNILAIVNGLIQIPQTDYTVFSGVVTFVAPPLSSSDIEIRYYTADDTGAQGPQGPVGVRGETGYNGSVGYSGSMGFSGSRGAVGYQGSKGIDAVNILFATSDPVTNTGFRGDQTLWWNPSAQVLYIYSGGAWNAVTTVGYKGSAGDRGATGYLGSTGLTGFTGSAGVGYVGSSGTAAPRLSQAIVSDGTNSYSLNESVSDAVTILVSVNGLVQIPEVDYTVSGTTITFNNTPFINSDIEIKYFGPKVGAVGFRGSVGYTGSFGETGYIGSVGYFGSQGITGFTGSVGDPGGSQGYTGSSGFAGSVGIGYAGSMGPAGAPREAITFIGNGVDTDFETYRNIANPSYVFVMVNGLVQLPNTDYTINNTTSISFSIPPIDGSDIEVRLFESSGYSGSEGFQGSRGSAGYRGSVGYAGSRGSVGFQGSKGLDGSPGGDVGYTGSSGLGYTGSAGVDGAYAALGFTGSKGDLGDKGDTGFTGSQGISGQAADKGYSGSRGFNGSKGETGDAGEVGYTGSAGVDGAYAALGFTGSKGDSGFVGSRGAGYTGSMGPVGSPKSNQTFVGNGSNQTFTLNKVLTSSKSAFVIVNGLVLIPDIDYTIDNETLTITDTPANLADIEIRYFDETGYTGSTGSTGFRGSVGYAGSKGLDGIPAYNEVYMGGSPPNNPEDGTMWWDNDNGILNIYYSDENTWVGIAQGPRGVRGYAGSAGPPDGYTGSRGDVGFVGSQGNNGYTGSIGIGYTGSQGIDGAYAAVGYTGSEGNGYSGSKGYTGSIGAGYTGSVGFVGSAGNGLQSRSAVSGTTSSIANNAIGNFTITGFKSFGILKIVVDAAAWVRIYSTSSARTADASRIETDEPNYNTGVLLEVITTGAETISLTPAVIGFNDEDPPATNIFVAVKNKSGSTRTIQVDLTLIPLEA